MRQWSSPCQHHNGHNGFHAASSHFQILLILDTDPCWLQAYAFLTWILHAGRISHPCFAYASVPGTGPAPANLDTRSRAASSHTVPSALEAIPGDLRGDAGSGCLMGCVDGRICVMQPLTQLQYDLLAFAEVAMAMHPATAPLSGWDPQAVRCGRCVSLPPPPPSGGLPIMPIPSGFGQASE